MPEQIFKNLAFVYNHLNKDLLSLYGIQINIDPLSDEKVDREKAQFFEISTDYVSSNLIAFLFLIGNIAFIFMLQFLVNFLKKSNWLRKLISEEKK